MPFDSGQSKPRWKELPFEGKPPTTINYLQPKELLYLINYKSQLRVIMYVREPKEKNQLLKNFIVKEKER